MATASCASGPCPSGTLISAPEVGLEVLWPLRVGVYLHPGFPRQPRLDVFQVLLEQCRWNAGAHAKHELLALADRFNCLRRELSSARHEANFRRDHILRRGV